LRTDLALDALEMAICIRNGEDLSELTHHSDRGVNTSPFDTPSGWPTNRRWPRSDPRGTRSTTPWPKP
jgi:hypothetical protein